MPAVGQRISASFLPLRLRQTHLRYFGAVGVGLRHVLVVLVLEGPHFLVLHRLRRHVLLLQLLCQSVVFFLLLVVEFIEVDLHRGHLTFWTTSRLFLSARMRISPYLID